MVSSTFFGHLSGYLELNDRYHMILSQKNHSLIGFLVIFSPTKELLVEKVVAQFFSSCNTFPS